MEGFDTQKEDVLKGLENQVREGKACKEEDNTEMRQQHQHGHLTHLFSPTLHTCCRLVVLFVYFSHGMAR